jgi:hypothetical protein
MCVCNDLCLLVHEICTIVRGWIPSRVNRRRDFPPVDMPYEPNEILRDLREKRERELHAALNPRGLRPKINLSHLAPSNIKPDPLLLQKILEERANHQWEDLGIDWSHHTYREPPSNGSVASSSTVPIYATPDFTPDLAYRYARVGKPKVKRGRHAPPPGRRRPPEFSIYSIVNEIEFEEGAIRDWRTPALWSIETKGYVLPGLRRRRQGFLRDLAKIRKICEAHPEQMRKAYRDKRLADAVIIPPPRDINMLRRRPLRLPGAFPTLIHSGDEFWYGKREPVLPDGVKWKAGGSMPTFGVAAVPYPGIPWQKESKSLGAIHRF